MFVRVVYSLVRRCTVFSVVYCVVFGRAVYCVLRLCNVR